MNLRDLFTIKFNSLHLKYIRRNTETSRDNAITHMPLITVIVPLQVIEIIARPRSENNSITEQYLLIL